MTPAIIIIDLQKYFYKLATPKFENKIDTLFIAGFSGDVCVRMTTMDAFNRGYNLFWISDCIESLFEDYKKSEEYIQNLTKLKVVTIEEIKKIWRTQQ